MPMEIIVSGPSRANQVRLRDRGNSLMTPDPVLYRSRLRFSLGFAAPVLNRPLCLCVSRLVSHR